MPSDFENTLRFFMLFYSWQNEASHKFFIKSKENYSRKCWQAHYITRVFITGKGVCTNHGSGLHMCCRR